MKHASGMLEHDRRWYRNPDLVASSLLVALGVLFFADVLFTSKNFYFRDILNFHYPLRKVLIDSYARGEWPLWNPYVYLGQPMLANPNYMAFYPSNLFHLFLPFNYAFKLHFVIHPILASLGIYFLQRRLSLPPIACFGGAVVYAFSGIVLSFLNLYNFVPSVALLPWIGWAFLGAVRKPIRGRILLFGALLALQVLAVDLFIGLCDVLVLAALAATEMSDAPSPAREARTILRVGLLGVLFAVGLAAVQILPTLELIPRSVRGTGYTFENVTQWSMHPMDLLNMVIPNLFGNPYTLTKNTYWGEPYHFGREGYLVSFFFGIGPCLLAVLSFLNPRKRTQVLFLILGLLGIFLSLGRYNPLWHPLFQYIPVFRLGRYPSKFILLTALSLSVLVSLGVEVCTTKLNQKRKAVSPLLVAGVIGSVLGAVILGFALYLSWHPPFLQQLVAACLSPGLLGSKNMPVIASQLGGNLRWCGTFAALLAVTLLASIYLKRAVLGGALLVFALSAEILPQNLRLVPLMSETDVNFVSEVNEYLGAASKEGTFRVMALESSRRDLSYELRAPNDSLAWNSLFFKRAGLPFYGVMNGIEYSLYIPVDGLSTTESNGLLQYFRQAGGFRRPEVLQRTNSAYIATLDRVVMSAAKLEAEYPTGSDFKLNLYRLAGVLDRAYLVSGVRKVSSQIEALNSLSDPEFPIRDTVILESPRVPPREGRQHSSEVRLIDHESQYISCDTNNGVPGYLVLVDSYYPGWLAYVDGRRVPILRANYAFRAVEVPAGEHRVEFRYGPWTFYTGLCASLLSLAAGVFLLRFRPSVD